MNCDDRLGVVKRDDDSHPLSTDVTDVCPLPVSAELDALRRGHEPFGIGSRRSDLPRPVLGMSREAHTCLSSDHADLSPQGPWCYDVAHGDRGARPAQPDRERH